MAHTGWSAKRFFLSEKKTAKMVSAKREGVTFRDLEKKFHLKDMHGMSAYRIIRWAKQSPAKQAKHRARILKHVKEGADV